MNFINDFLWHSLLAAFVASLWFTLPGLLALRLLGLLSHFRTLSAWLVAPAFGLCTYGPFSLAFTTLFGYSTLTLLIAWLVFQAGLWLWHKKRLSSESTENFCTLPPHYSILLLLGATLWSLMATMQIVPTLYQGGLFVNTPIFDHAKVAIVDAIAREGLLPVNPYYAPDGNTIPLIYYYTWSFLASQLKLLAGVTGWQAEVAFNWYTGFATLSLLCAFAIRLTQRPVAGLCVILLALGGPPTDLLAPLFGPRLENWFAIPPGHGLEVLWLQMMWVPQHVLSAVAVLLLLFLLSRILSDERLQVNYVVITGLCAATGFGASTWVGGIGLMMISPVLLLMVVWLRLPLQNYLNFLKTLVLAALVSVIFALPLLISQASGPSLAHSQLPFGLGILASTRFFSIHTHAGLLGHIVFFWLQFLPLTLGIIYILGLPALLARTSSSLEDRAFQLLSIGGTVGYLLLSQWVKSTFWNNTFGWRAVLVPVLLLTIWSAVALTELATNHFTAITKWRPQALLVRWRLAVLPVTVVGLTIGILSTIWIWRLPDPSYAPPPPDVLALHQGFLRQQEAWAKVREYADPTDRVQANPDGYATLTPWPATLPYALFADRATAYANVEYTTVFAYRYNQEQNKQQYQLLQTVFSAHPPLTALRKVRDTLKVKVLLIDKFDAVWQADDIERSGIYNLVHQEADFKIYVASKVQ